MNYCQHCIDGSAEVTIVFNGREHVVCQKCADFFEKDGELPDFYTEPLRQLGHTRPMCLDDIEDKMGSDGTNTLKIPGLCR